MNVKALLLKDYSNVELNINEPNSRKVFLTMLKKGEITINEGSNAALIGILEAYDKKCEETDEALDMFLDLTDALSSELLERGISQDELQKIFYDNGFEVRFNDSESDADDEFHQVLEDLRMEQREGPGGG